jgi:hypothetical protein
MQWVTLTSQKLPWVTFVPTNVHVQYYDQFLLKCELRKWRNVVVRNNISGLLWVTLNFPKLPWETFVHKPLSQGTFFITISISDEGFGDMSSDGRTDVRGRTQQQQYAFLIWFLFFRGAYKSSNYSLVVYFKVGQCTRIASFLEIRGLGSIVLMSGTILVHFETL